MAKNRFFKMTPGVPVEVLFGKTLSTEATLTSFQSTAAVGEYGLYRKDGTIVDTTSAMSIADKKKELIWVYKETTTIVRQLSPMLAGNVTPTINLYKPGINQVATTANATVGTVDTTQELVFKVIETTPGNENLPTWTYTTSLAPGEEDAWTDIAAQINAANDEEFFTCVGAADGCTVTGTATNRHFRIAAVIEPTPAGPEDSGVYYIHTYTTASNSGSGSLDHANDLWEWDNIYSKGVTHNYPDNSMANSSDFGLPATVAEVVTSTTKFDIVVLTAYRTEHSPTPVEKHARKSYIYLVIPTSTVEVTLTGSTGDLDLKINGVTYSETFDTNLTTTAAAFVTSHAAAILAADGAVLTSTGAVLEFDNAVEAVDMGGDLTGTVSTSAISQDIVTYYNSL